MTNTSRRKAGKQKLEIIFQLKIIRDRVCKKGFVKKEILQHYQNSKFFWTYASSKKMSYPFHVWINRCIYIHYIYSFNIYTIYMYIHLIQISWIKSTIFLGESSMAATRKTVNGPSVQKLFWIQQRHVFLFLSNNFRSCEITAIILANLPKHFNFS